MQNSTVLVPQNPGGKSVLAPGAHLITTMALKTNCSGQSHLGSTAETCMESTEREELEQSPQAAPELQDQVISICTSGFVYESSPRGYVAGSAVWGSCVLSVLNCNQRSLRAHTFLILKRPRPNN